MRRWNITIPQEDSSYAQTIIDDADFTATLANICFPTDLSYVNTSLSQLIDYAIKYFPYGTSYLNDEDGNMIILYDATLDIETKELYAPFAILKGDDAKDVADDDVYATFELTDPDEAISEGVMRG